MNKKIFNLALAGILAAFYLVLTLPFAQFAFGLVQFRLAETLTVLPVLTPAAIPGVFIGCLFSNLLNPQNLGLVDILGGSLTTLLAAFLTYKIGSPFRRYVLSGSRLGTPEAGHYDRQLDRKQKINLFLALLPPVILNGLVVGTYLPFLLTPDQVSLALVVSSILTICLSQAIVIYGLGFPLALLLSKNRTVLDYIHKKQ